MLVSSYSRIRFMSACGLWGDPRLGTSGPQNFAHPWRSRVVRPLALYTYTVVCQAPALVQFQAFPMLSRHVSFCTRCELSTDQSSSSYEPSGSSENIHTQGRESELAGCRNTGLYWCWDQFMRGLLRCWWSSASSACSWVSGRSLRRRRSGRGAESIAMAACDLDRYGIAGPIPKVGVAVLIRRGSSVLCGRRKSRVAYDHWALPGGHLEFGETFEECASREVEEETGLRIQNVRLGTVTNTIMLDDLRPTHYVTVYVRADMADPEAQPEVLEPEKCDGWRWIEWPNVPDPMFKPLEELISTKYDPFL